MAVEPECETIGGLNRCMSNSLKASTQGLAIVDRARQRHGWTKTSTARWWQDAHTSRATLRRFWQGERIQREIFIAICQAVGLNNWEAIADQSDSSVPLPFDPSEPLKDWNEAPDVEVFYGRNRELQQLEQWIVVDGCRQVTIAGMAGIGKTVLAVALADRLQSRFECLIWKSLQAAPPLLTLLDSLLSNFDAAIAPDIPQRMAELMQHLRQRRCLLVLDGLEAVLQTEERASEYAQFLQQVNQQRHPSCWLITSQEKLPAIEINTQTTRCLSLRGLQSADAVELLQARGLSGQEPGLSTFIRLYRGNPLALKMAVPLIQSIFNGNVAAFLQQNMLVMGDRLRGVLKQQLNRLSELEREILYWLAIWQEPISFCRLQTHLLGSIDPATILETMAELEQRSLIEKWFSCSEPAFTLQPLVMKAVVEELIEQAFQEIHQAVQNSDISYFKVLRTHWLLRPGTDELAGDRILTQLREKLWRLYGSALSQTFHPLLLQLENQPPFAIGYTGCNLMALLKQIQ